jgi:hypothetical protein
MGKCNNCGKKIEYNKFKRYRKKILCYECYDTRLERKKVKKDAAELAAKNEEELQKKTEEFALANGDLAEPIDMDSGKDEQPEESED